MTRYELESVRLPRLVGRRLSWAARALESEPTRAVLLRRLFRQGGIDKLRAWRIQENPTPLPFEPPAGEEGDRAEPELGDLARAAGGPVTSIGDYAEAYRRKLADPEEVAARFTRALAATDELTPPLRAFIAADQEDLLAQARASTARLARGEALSPLDGVPIAVKDELDQAPYPTTVGTRFLGSGPAAEDATPVARLRAAGALLVGKTNMHEIGINPNGLNVHYGIARNPYDLARDTGGSSSGSAAAVAAGLCAGALGADAGGSIRIPAAHCGIVGLKATFARVSERGAAPLCWSVAHVGPLAPTVADAALLYRIIAGRDERDPMTRGAPPVSLAGWDESDLSDLRLGVYRPWFEHASDEVVAANRAALDALSERGARVVEVEVPELEEMRLAHVATILSEMAASMENHPEHRSDLGAGVRINLAFGRGFTATDYVRAQRMRTRAMRIMQGVFEEVDVLVTPATGMTAPRIPKDALPYGWSDLATVTEVMRFAPPANLTGVPALVFPVGYDAAGLPIGMQAMARHWRESLLFRVGLAAESKLERRLPSVHHSLF